MTRRVAASLLLLGLAACPTPYYQRNLPRPVSPDPVAPEPGTRYLRAGFGKADITPVPGVGLAGNGPEGRRAEGWRTHLFARALVLEDGTGELIAFVIADLTHISSSLHREVAALTLGPTGIGADRLILSATHTHAGPSHFYAEQSYNAQSSRVSGYDPAVERLLVRQIASAIVDAHAARRRAWLTVDYVDLPGFTRNRSVTAYCANPAGARKPVPCPNAPPISRADSIRLAPGAVNHLLTLLRVDFDAAPGTGSAPGGLLGIFAMHGTGNSNTGTLLDGDLHGLVMRTLEDSLRAANGGNPVALFMNSTEGDVSPDFPTHEGGAPRCPLPALGPAVPVTAVRGMARRYDFISGSPERDEDCLRASRRFVDDTAPALAARIYTAARRSRLDPDGNALRLFRSFTTLLLPGIPDLCPTATAGSAAVGGAEDGQTRLWHWEPLAPFYFLRLNEGGKAVQDPPRGCHREKHQIEWAQKLILGEHGAPDVAQLSLVRIGRLIVGAVPAEVTTVAGIAMRDSIARNIGQPGLSGDSVPLIGLANGFLQYVNTGAEYAVQSYEGGSNLYGPSMAGVLAREFGRLARMLPSSGASPRVEVAAITAYPGAPQVIMPDSVGLPAAVARRITEAACHRNSVRVSWLDLPPGRIQPWDGRVLIELEGRGAGTSLKTADGSPALGIRQAGSQGKAGHRWEATWTLPRPVDSIRVTLPAGAGRAAVDTTIRLRCGPTPP